MRDVPKNISVSKYQKGERVFKNHTDIMLLLSILSIYPFLADNKLEAAWPSGQGAGLESGDPESQCWICSRQSLVQLLGCACIQPIVCLLPFGILNLLSSFQLLVSLALKCPSRGSGRLSMFFFVFKFLCFASLSTQHHSFFKN